MPLPFPSHQGLILPLQRRFPRRIDGVALCVGALMPDLLDGIAGPFRGGLGQWAGHSLLGVVISVLPGLVLARIVRRVLPGAAIARLDAGAPAAAGPLRESLSVGLGSLSHVAFDLPTHGGFLLLWPLFTGARIFPSWWCHAWWSFPVPFYREPYPMAPHTIAWIAMSVVGAVLFVLSLRSRGSAGDG